MSNLSQTLRVELIVLAIIFIIVVFTTINKQKLQMRYSLIWILLSLGMIVVAFFPQIVICMSYVVQIETPSNFIYLLAIFALLILSFFLTVNMSIQSEKTKKMIQILSIEHYLELEHRKE